MGRLPQSKEEIVDKDMVKLQVSDEIITPVIEKAIQAAIIKNLGDTDLLLESMVALALKQKVNEKGGISKYSSDNKYYFVDVHCQNTIREVAKKAFQEWLDLKRDKIKEILLKELKKPAFQAKIAKSLIGVLNNTLEYSWYVKHDVIFKIDGRD